MMKLVEGLQTRPFNVCTHTPLPPKPIHVLLQGVDLHYENWEELTELLRNSIRGYEVTLSQGK